MSKTSNHSEFMTEFMKNFHSNRTPEQKAATAKKTSESIKTWHAKMSAEKKKERQRKISASQQIRNSQIPPRMKRDLNKKRSEGHKKFQDTPESREHRKYIGYLSSQDILHCEPERKARIIKKRQKGQQKKWDSLTPEQKKERVKNTLGKNKKKRANVHLFYEKDVPRVKDYCGVVTEEDMELMYG